MLARPHWRRRSGVGLIAALAASALTVGVPAAASAADEPWLNTSLDAAQRADLLLAELSLEDKVTLLTQSGGEGLPEYGIPAIRGKDASNGLSNEGGSTALPVGLALASTWDTDLAYDYGTVAGSEAREVGYNSAASPSLDLARTPWAGRIWESFGEDPYLTGTLATSQTVGIQDQEIPAEAKHYSVYNAESRRGHVDAIVDERTLQEVYTRPWEQLVSDADLASVMCSFNQVNGAYACGNESLLTGVLKDQLGFQGYVQTDFNAAHGLTDYEAGLDTSGEDLSYSGDNLLAAVESGEVSEERVTDAARRVLWTMFEFGIVDNPPVGSFDSAWTAAQLSDATLAAGDEVAQSVGEQGTVLLKNDDILPLSTDGLDSIAVIGAEADSYIDGGGSAAVTTPSSVTTMLDGITARAGDGVEVNYASGTDPAVLGDTLPGPAAVPSSVLSDVTASYRLGADNEDGDPFIERSENQIDLRSGLAADTDNNTSAREGLGWLGAISELNADWTGTLTAPATGTYELSLTVLGSATLTVDGAEVLTVDADELEVASAQVELTADQPVSVAVHYVTDAPDQFDGSLNDQPGAMLRLGWTPPEGVVSPSIAAAAALAASSDVAVVVARDYTGEAADRASLQLPQDQDALIEAVAAANPRTIVVLATSGAVTMPWLDDVSGVLEAWYGGQVQGESVASILFGDVNPSGRLPITFPVDDEQAASTGVTNPFEYVGELEPTVEYSEGLDIGYRSYVRDELDPLFAFGYGLSYTDYSYADDLTLPEVDATAEAGVAGVATVTVTNTGAVDGTETVQLYAGALPTDEGSASQALAGFASVDLAAGESRTVEIQIDRRTLQYWDTESDAWVMPEGEVPIYLARSATDIIAEGTLTVQTSDTQAPTVEIAAESTPSGKNYQGSAELTITAQDDTDAAPLIEVNVDGEGFTALDGSTLTVTGKGTHTVEARATDAAGNVSEIVSWSGRIVGNGNSNGNGNSSAAAMPVWMSHFASAASEHTGSAGWSVRTVSQRWSTGSESF